MRQSGCDTCNCPSTAIDKGLSGVTVNVISSCSPCLILISVAAFRHERSRTLLGSLVGINERGLRPQIRGTGARVRVDLLKFQNKRAIVLENLSTEPVAFVLSHPGLEAGGDFEHVLTGGRSVYEELQGGWRFSLDVGDVDVYRYRKR